MVKIYNSEGKRVFYVGKDIYNLAMRIKQKINEEDQESWQAMIGDTGCGKSVFGQHWGYLIDKTLDRKIDPDSINRICFSVEEFIKAVNNAKKGQVVIADEAISIAFSRAAMTKGGRKIAQFKDQIRQKNLCIILCIPDLLDLDYSFIKKIDILFYVWESRIMHNGRMQTLKGNFACYPELKGFGSRGMLRTKFHIYQKIKKANPFKRNPKPTPLYTQKGSPVTKVPFYPVGRTAYLKKKNSILKKFDEKEEEKPLTDRQKHVMNQRNKAFAVLKITARSVNEIIGINVGFSCILDNLV